MRSEGIGNADLSSDHRSTVVASAAGYRSFKGECAFFNCCTEAAGNEVGAEDVLIHAVHCCFFVTEHRRIGDLGKRSDLPTLIVKHVSGERHRQRNLHNGLIVKINLNGTYSE